MPRKTAAEILAEAKRDTHAQAGQVTDSFYEGETPDEIRARLIAEGNSPEAAALLLYYGLGGVARQ